MAPGLNKLKRSTQNIISAADITTVNSQMQPYLDGAFPKTLATRTVMLDYLFPALEVVEIAVRRGTEVELVAKVFTGLGHSLNLR